MSSAAPTYYDATANARAPVVALSGTHKADTVVVGGGYAGLATALGLVERGVGDVVVLESSRIGAGASGRNGGFVFGGWSLGEDALLAQLGRDRARRVYAATLDAIALIRTRIARYRIDCAAVDDGVLWANWFRDDVVLEQRRRLLAEHYGVHWQPVSRERLAQMVASPRYSGALHEARAFHFHPLNYAIGLDHAARGMGVRVHEQTRARRLVADGAGWRIECDGASIRARRVVLACGGYLAGLVPRIDRAILPIATYVMATEPLGERLGEVFPGTRAAVYDTRFAFDYYRPLADTSILWGGRISIRDRAPADVARLLKRDLLKVFPQLDGVRIDHAWSGLMAYARHQMPQIAELQPGLWCTQGFGGHGVATTTAAGEMIAAAIVEGDASWRDLEPYGFPNAWKPLGHLAAQAEYWRLQLADALRR
jgi:gamma-glutamylputrescine oxidase